MGTKEFRERVFYYDWLEARGFKLPDDIWERVWDFLEEDNPAKQAYEDNFGNPSNQ